MHIFATIKSARSLQYPMYVFHLYADESVDSVTIVTEKPMLHGSLTMALKPCSKDRKYWRSPQLFILPNEQETFRYRYWVKYSKGLVDTVRSYVARKVTGKEDERTVLETHARNLNKGMQQYDIFRNPSDQSARSCIFRGQTFFIKLLFQKLENGGDLKELLMECEHVGFGHPSYQTAAVKQFLKWFEDAIDNSRTPYQGIFFCSLLGQLVDRGRNWPADYTCSLLGSTFADSILSSIARCPYLALTQSSIRFIETVAEELFKAGSSKGCLLFIKYFCNHLDANYVMQVVDKLSSQTYTENQFEKHVSLLLTSLEKLTDCAICTMYSSYVVKSSPTIRCLWNLFYSISHCLPDLVQSLTKDFSTIYGTFISGSQGRKPGLLDPIFWSQVPEKLKNELASPFCNALADQVRLENTWSWSQEKLVRLKAVAVDRRLHSSDDFRHFAMGIMTHKCKEVVSLLPYLLKSNTYCCVWRNAFTYEEKENVCSHWLKTSCANGTEPKERILAFVEACELLCTTEALKSDKKLCEAIHKEVENLVLKMDFQSITRAFQDAQNSSPTVYEHLMSLLRRAIKQQSGTGDRHLRFRQMIRMLGLDISRERKKGPVKAKITRWVKYLFYLLYSAQSPWLLRLHITMVCSHIVQNLEFDRLTCCLLRTREECSYQNVNWLFSLLLLGDE